jgi:hypothetical protein
MERLVAGNENVEAIILRHPEKRTILQVGPSEIGRRERLVVGEERPQVVRGVSVEQNLQSCNWCLWAKARIFRIVSTGTVGN